ncbi:MAG: SDR family oxidoreductase [Thiotrichales bacterium]|nr:SDR family oxidoreductase [Thiotrichales bacterium]
MQSERIAIVTAAGRGMGAAIARELAAQGYTLALLSSSGAAETLADELGGLGLTGSVTEPADLERLVNATLERHARIDAVVNNTGHVAKGDLLDLDDAAWHASLDMALLNVVRMARLVTPVMRAQGGGAIVNISTFSAFEPSLDYPVSSTLRAGLGSFTKLYAERYAADNIRMNNILPGFIDSLPHGEDKSAKVPMRRIGTMAEIAKTAAFLLGDGAGYITGQNLRVDGGLTRSV